MKAVCSIPLGLVWRECMLFCLGWEWDCLSVTMYVFPVGMIGRLLLLCLCRCVLMLRWCRLRMSWVLLVPVLLERQMCICWKVWVIGRHLVEHQFSIDVVLIFCFWMWCMLCSIWCSLKSIWEWCVGCLFGVVYVYMLTVSNALLMCRWFVLVEASYDGVVHVVWCCACIVDAFEAMLCGDMWDTVCDVWE